MKKNKKKNTQSQKDEDYYYFVDTWWLNNNTTDGWGAFPTSGLSGGNNNNTQDYISGYGIDKRTSTIPNGKKLKTVYIYKGKEYLNAYNVVFDDNNRPHQVYQAPGVKRIYRIVSV